MNTSECIESGMVLRAATTEGQTQQVTVEEVDSDLVPQELTGVDRAFLGTTKDNRYFLHLQSNGTDNNVSPFPFSTTKWGDHVTLLFDTKHKLAEYLWEHRYDSTAIVLLAWLEFLKLDELRLGHEHPSVARPKA